MPVVHNRGKKMGDKTVARKIIFPQGWDKDGNPNKDGKKPLEDILQPGQHKKVTDAQFKHLKENFNDEIINVEDLKEMQAQFPEKEAEKPRAGYVAPEEVDAMVAKRVEEEMAKLNVVEGGAKEPEPYEALALRIDSMDRPDLIALIEKEELGIEAKNFKNPNALKAAILTALENKEALKSEPKEDAA